MIPVNNKPSVFIFILILNSISLNNYAQVKSATDLNIIAHDSLNLTVHETMKEVLLDSNPQDAYVFHNDSLIGNTPIFVPSSLNNLKLKKNGYNDLNILFEEITPRKIFTLSFAGYEKEKSFFERDIFKILAAGIVVLGGTTAYFKLKADSKFDEYEFSGNSKVLDETRKYDLISGITFTALQINFGLLLYYFLIE